MSVAEQLISQLKEHVSEKELAKLDKFFKGDDGKTRALGVKFGVVFETAKEFKNITVEEISKLLDSDYYEVRMAAAAVMDFQARDKKLSAEKRKALFDLYLERHDRLNNWDFVDRAAANVIGRYLEDKPRDVLYKLAKSDNVWERRTAIVSTHHFIRQGDLDDTFQIADILLYDEHELINRAVGSWLREAGKKDQTRLKEFLQKYAATMPRVTLRYAIEKMAPAEKEFYLNSQGKGGPSSAT